MGSECLSDHLKGRMTLERLAMFFCLLSIVGIALMILFWPVSKTAKEQEPARTEHEYDWSYY